VVEPSSCGACCSRGQAPRLVAAALTGLQRPDFRTISDFRQRHLAALGALFVRVLQLCRTAGLVRLGHVALDGTKLKANASKHKAMLELLVQTLDCACGLQPWR
jgi:transposase